MSYVIYYWITYLNSTGNTRTSFLIGTKEKRLRNLRQQVNFFWFTYVISFPCLKTFLLIYICKLHWNLQIVDEVSQSKYEFVTDHDLTITVLDRVVDTGKLLMIYLCYFHVLRDLLLIYICKLHLNLDMMFVCQVNSLWFTYVITMS